MNITALLHLGFGSHEETNQPTSLETPSATSSSVSRSYMEGFTIHGLSKVFMGKLWEKIYWFLILIGVFGFVAFKIHGFYARYQSNDFRTEIRMVDIDIHKFPELKICINRDYIGPENCYKNVSENGLPCERKYFEIIADIAGVFTELNTTKDYLSPVSCVRYTPLEYENIGLGGLPVFASDIYEENITSTGFSMYIENGLSFGEVTSFTRKPHEFGAYRLEVMDIKNISRLHHPFQANCTNGEGLNVFSGPYTRKKCFHTLFSFNDMLKRCGDVPDHWKQYVKPGHEKGWSTDAEERFGNRTDENIRRCISAMYPKKHSDVLIDFKTCPLPCTEVIFDSMITVVPLSDSEKSMHAEGGISVFYIDGLKRATEVTEIPDYTSDDFFSDVGSWLGLLMGMSFLSLVELVTFIATAIGERLC